MALSSDLDLHSVLARIVESATALTDAGYGALGVLGRDDTLGEFVTTGLTRRSTSGSGRCRTGAASSVCSSPSRVRSGSTT